MASQGYNIPNLLAKHVKYKEVFFWSAYRDYDQST